MFVEKKNEAPPAPEGYTRLNQNLNDRVSDVHQYLCIKRDENSPKVTDFAFYRFDQPFPFNKIEDWTVAETSMHKKDGHSRQSYVYLLYKKEG